MKSKEIAELAQLIEDDGTSEDAIWEWCNQQGGYIEVIAVLLERLQSKET